MLRIVALTCERCPAGGATVATDARGRVRRQLGPVRCAGGAPEPHPHRTQRSRDETPGHLGVRHHRRRALRQQLPGCQFKCCVCLSMVFGVT